MSEGRVALVTGGTRGIGAQISIELKAAGYRVVANYGGNDAAAETFKSETGIPVYKFDVADFEAVKAAIAQITADVGPIEVLVNNVAPGYTDTEMVRAVPANVLEKIIAGIPVKRLGSVHDIARAVTFLAADEAGFITGSTLSINGGQHMY